MTEGPFVRVEGAPQLLMTTGDPPTGPLVISHQPPQDLLLERGRRAAAMGRLDAAREPLVARLCATPVRSAAVRTR